MGNPNAPDREPDVEMQAMDEGIRRPAPPTLMPVTHDDVISPEKAAAAAGQVPGNVFKTFVLYTTWL